LSLVISQSDAEYWRGLTPKERFDWLALGLKELWDASDPSAQAAILSSLSAQFQDGRYIDEFLESELENSDPKERTRGHLRLIPGGANSR